MKNHLIIITLLIITSACSHTPLTSIRSKANYESELQSKNHIALLPPSTEAYTVGFKKERMYNYEYALENLISQELEPIFKRKGYNTKVISKTNAHNKGALGNITDLKESHTSKLKTLHNPEHIDVKLASNSNITFNNDLTNKIKKSVDAEILSLVYYNSNITNNALRTVNFALGLLSNRVGDGSAENSTMIISLINAKTGSLLWSNICSKKEGLISSTISNLSSQEDKDKKFIRTLGECVLSSLPDRKNLAMVKK